MVNPRPPRTKAFRARFDIGKPKLLEVNVLGVPHPSRWNIPPGVRQFMQDRDAITGQRPSQLHSAPPERSACSANLPRSSTSRGGTDTVFNAGSDVFPGWRSELIAASVGLVSMKRTPRHRTGPAETSGAQSRTDERATRGRVIPQRRLPFGRERDPASRVAGRADADRIRLR